MHRKTFIHTFLIASIVSPAGVWAGLDSESFTYQGELRQDGVPYDGLNGLEFRLFDSATGGRMIGRDILIEELQIIDGLFTVELNFGAGAFNGDDRWLEIAVEDPPLSGQLTTLRPRQPVSATPYATRAALAEGLPGVYVGAGEDIGIGETNPLVPLHVQLTDLGVDSSMLGANTVGVLEGTDTILRLFADGGGLTGAAITLQEINGGVSTDAWTIRRRTSGDGSGLDFSHSDGTVMRMLPNGKIGIGTMSPGSVIFNSKLDIAAGHIALDNNYGVLSYNSDRTGPGAGFDTSPEDDLFLWAGGDDRVTVQANGRIGIGTTAPAARLHVKGRGTGIGNHIAVFENDDGTNADGIAIKIGNASTNRNNNFVTFLNRGEEVVGRIEGFDLENGDWQAPPPMPTFAFDLDLGIELRPSSDWFTRGTLPTVAFSDGELPSLSFSRGALPSLDITTCSVVGISVICGLDFDSGNLPSATFDPGNLPDLSFSAGTLPQITGSPLAFNPPSLDFNLPRPEQIQDLFCWALENGIWGVLSMDPLSQATEALRIQAIQICRDEGVVYGSRGADYAEYLEKQNIDEQFRFGEVVGVFGGKITKTTDGAEQVMVVSRAPAVVGNMPSDDDLDAYEKVAFMGQVPVVVRGRASVGDYLLPSSLHDGTAIAISPDALTVTHLSQVIGRAWSASPDGGLNFVNVVIGVRDEAAAIVLARQTQQLDDQAEEIASLKRQMATIAEALQAADIDIRTDSTKTSTVR